MSVDCSKCANNKQAIFCKAGKDKSFVQIIKDACESFVSKSLEPKRREAV